MARFMAKPLAASACLKTWELSFPSPKTITIQHSWQPYQFQLLVTHYPSPPRQGPENDDYLGLYMRVLMFFSNSFTNDPRVYNEAKSLIQAGHPVTVIAWDRQKQNSQRQAWDGIEIVRVKTWLSPGYGLGSPPWHGFHLLLWQWRAYRQALALDKENAFNVIHCYFF